MPESTSTAIPKQNYQQVERQPT